MQKSNAMLAVIFAGIATGCATVVSESSYPIAINSAPDGAYFTVTNRDGVEVNRGTTPMTIELKAGGGYFKTQTYTIVLSKAGYDEQTVSVRSTMDGWYWGNLLIGGLVGMLIIDPITGAMYKLPESVDVDMNGEPIEAVEQISAVDRDLGIVLASLDDLSEAQRALLQPIE